ncbi:Uncharacterised protein [Bordetella pertussis]|nr:Uncharacterised protein [Bordetella pertussis]
MSYSVNNVVPSSGSPLATLASAPSRIFMPCSSVSPKRSSSWRSTCATRSATWASSG